jgi:hypothetical protein
MNSIILLVLTVAVCGLAVINAVRRCLESVEVSE